MFPVDPKDAVKDALRMQGRLDERPRPAIFKTEDGHLVWMHPAQCCMRSISADRCGIVYMGREEVIDVDPGNAIAELKAAMRGESTIVERLEKLGFTVSVKKEEEPLFGDEKD